MSLKRIEYLKMANDALLAVVKDVLSLIAQNGLFKKQHLYITFATRHPGIEVSDFLREDFDEDMTIVLQYEFWDLVVDEYGFSVSLEFEHGTESLYIPFSSIISISDPSEEFSLDFVPNFSNKKDTKAAPQDVKQLDNDKSDNVISLDLFRKGK